MLISFAILAIVGIVSGLLPAVRASRMDPVVALRHE
jgi:putative ABC transport system permease protein